MLQDLTDEEEILRRAFQFFDKDGNGERGVGVRGVVCVWVLGQKTGTGEY
jgi:hypothetical protein